MTNDQFHAKVAETEEDKRVAYGIRYQAFCVDYPYLPADDYPDHQESDAWDKHSVSFLLYAAGQPVGVSRLILDSADGFQTESYGHVPSTLPRSEMAEVSRLAVLKQFSDTDKTARRAGLLLLNQAMFMYSLTHGINYWFATMFVRIYQLYSDLNVPFKLLSTEQHRWPDENGGFTVPVLLELQKVLPYLYHANRELYAQVVGNTEQPAHYDAAEMDKLQQQIESEHQQMANLVDKA
ncbi:MAG TPA: GNAT family N-acyltransferase [Candidatus Saccharimonas sp.]|nr:GNAT family N-acyltransferase [Candidatus Saccharimonas sp.]